MVDPDAYCIGGLTQISAATNGIVAGALELAGERIEPLVKS